MPCIVEEIMSNSEWYQKNLCKACKFLTKEEMASIQVVNGMQDLFSWYKGHLVHDFITNTDENEKNIAMKEAYRLGYVIHEIIDEIHPNGGAWTMTPLNEWRIK